MVFGFGDIWCRFVSPSPTLFSASALRFRELSKRFFAIRLIFFLALTDAAAATFNILGAFSDAFAPADGDAPVLCVLQSLGLLYFNLASIMWTSCFAFVRARARTLRTAAAPSATRVCSHAPRGGHHIAVERLRDAGRGTTRGA